MTIVRQGVYLPAVPIGPARGPAPFVPSKTKVYHGPKKPKPKKEPKPIATPAPRSWGDLLPVKPAPATTFPNKPKRKHLTPAELEKLRQISEEERRKHPERVYATGSSSASGLASTLDDLAPAPVFDELNDLLSVFGIGSPAAPTGDGSADVPSAEAEAAQAESEAPKSSAAPWIIGAGALLVLVLVMRGL